MPELALHSFSDRALILILALGVSAALSGPSWLRQFLFLDRPGRAVRALLRAVEKKLNRAHRSAATRRARGLFTVAMAAVVSLFAGMAFSHLAASGKWTVFVEILALALLMPLRPPLAEAAALRELLLAGKTADAATRVEALTGRQTGDDTHAQARAAIEYLAVYFGLRIVGVITWYLLLGLPAALFYVVLLVMTELFGWPGDATRDFGAPIRRLADLLQLLPSRVAGIILALAAAVTPQCRPLKALKAFASTGQGYLSVSYGAVIAAAAGALGIALGGPRNLYGTLIPEPWADAGPARVGASDLRRMQWLYATGCGIVTLTVAALNLVG